MERISDLETADAKLKAMQTRIAAVLAEHSTSVRQIRGLGAVTTGRDA